MAKELSCARKGGNAARWQLGKLVDIQEERAQSAPRVCTLPRRNWRRYKTPNHCLTTLAGKLHAAAASLEFYRNRRRRCGGLKQAKETSGLRHRIIQKLFIFNRCDANARLLTLCRSPKRSFLGVFHPSVHLRLLLRRSWLASVWKLLFFGPPPAHRSNVS